MYIDNWNVAEAGAKLFNIEMGNQSVKTSSEWVAGSLIPSLPGVSFGFKSLTLTVLVYGTSRNEARQRVSEILGHLTEAVDLYLDGMETIFRGTLKGHSVTEPKFLPGWSGYRRFLQLTLNFDGYEYGEEITVEKVGDSGNIQKLDVINPGSGKTPARLVIECLDKTRNECVIDGLQSGEIRIPRIYTQEIYDLDGETGVMTITRAGGAVSLLTEDAEIWELPAIAPGPNKLTIAGAGSGATIRVTFKPRYI